MMNKELIFQPISEKWTQVNTNTGDSVRTLADTLQDLEIVINDNAHFVE